MTDYTPEKVLEDFEYNINEAIEKLEETLSALKASRLEARYAQLSGEDEFKLVEEVDQNQ